MIWGKRDGHDFEYAWDSVWSKWFAWYPVTLIDGRSAWMCYVDTKRSEYSWIKKRVGFGDLWYYREIAK